MGEEESIGDEIIVVAETDLERWKCLLIILQRIEILPSAAV